MVNQFNSNERISQQLKREKIDNLSNDISSLNTMIKENIVQIDSNIRKIKLQIQGKNMLEPSDILIIIDTLLTIITTFNSIIIKLNTLIEKLSELKQWNNIFLIQTYVDDNINKLVEQINHIEEQLQEFNEISETLKLNEYQHNELYDKIQEFEVQLSTIMKEILSIVKQLSLKQVEVSEQQSKLELQKFKYIISLVTQLLSSGGLVYLIIEKLLSK